MEPHPSHRCPWTISLALVLAMAGPAQADLLTYVNKPDPSFSWKLRAKIDHHQGTIYDLELVSQAWQGMTWKHQLQVYLPKGVKPAATLFLWNQGGRASFSSITMAMDFARKIQAPVAFLYHVPNQPLLKKTEDALIAETFVRYLNTGDDDWPLLFPMVKSLVRAMDALQEFARQEWNVRITHFVISGGSKRGWTTWLTGVVDGRVKAIAPMVIDILNFQAQLPHQRRSFGKYSANIADYTRRGLVPIPDTASAKHLWAMVDPWIHRAKLSMPKLIINGTNDPYWAVDSLNLYWDDLPGEKWVLYVPNAGHFLRQKHGDGRQDNVRARNALAAFAHYQIHGKPMPRLQWRHHDNAGRLCLTVQCQPAPEAARLWLAQAPIRDFRKTRWIQQTAEITDNIVHATIDPPTLGCCAFFAELDFTMDGLHYHLSTQIRVAGTPVAGDEPPRAFDRQQREQIFNEDAVAPLSFR